MRNAKNSSLIRLIQTAMVMLTLVTLIITTGCATTYEDTTRFVKKDKTPTNADILSGYYRISVKLSTAADVLDEIYMPDFEQLCQSKNVVAAAGTKKKGFKGWLKMAGFDENEPTARRKYLLIEDEKPKTLFADTEEKLFLECSSIINKDVLNKPYKSQNEKMIAIMKYMHANMKADVDSISAESQLVLNLGGMAKQALFAAIVKLENSPAMAAKLNSNEGIEFSHPSLDRGIVQMGLEYDTATIKLNIGAMNMKYKIDFEKKIEDENFDIW